MDRPSRDRRILRTASLATAIALIALGAGILAGRVARPVERPTDMPPAAPTDAAPAGEPASAAQASVGRLAVDPAIAAICDRARPGSERLRLLIGRPVLLGDDPRDQRALLAVLGDPAEGDALRNEIVNLLLRDGEAAAVERSLVAVVAAPAEGARFRSFAVQALGRLLLRAQDAGDAARADALRDRLRALSTHAEERSRREAVWALTAAGDAATIAWLRTRLDAPVDWSTDLAVRAVRDREDRTALPRLRALAKDSPDAVRVAAIEALGHLGDVESASLLAEIARDARGPARGAALAAQSRLALASSSAAPGAAP